MSVLGWTLFIFFARVCDVGLGTIRVQLIISRKKLLAAAIGFVEVLIYILIVSRVIRDIEYWPYLLAYAGGFSVGTLLGMWLADKLSHQVVQVTVISHEPGPAVEMAIREAGFALTRYPGEGRDGPVAVLDVICTARGLASLRKKVQGVDPRAFVYSHELAGLQGGSVYGLKSKM